MDCLSLSILAQFTLFPTEFKMNASTKVSYDPSNFPALAFIEERAAEQLNRAKGGAKALKTKIEEAADSGANLTPEFQVIKPDGGNALRSFTLGELADSAEHEITPQSVDLQAVEDILFGRYGLIRKTGGGRADRLMEDIEVAYIKNVAAGTTTGPIITSGRHRTLALQIMLKAAGMNGYRDFSVRCSVINVSSDEQVQDRIISANTGSRDFSRAEIRERLGSNSGVTLTSCQAIEATILLANKTADFKAAFSAYVKLLSSELQLNSFTPAQYSDSGNSLWNELEKLRPEGGTFAKWVKTDKEGRFRSVMTAVRQTLPTAVNQALHNPANGSKAGKIAMAL